MSDWINHLSYIICGAALLLSMLGLWFTAIMPGTDRWSRRFFRSYFTVLMLSCFSGLLEVILMRNLVPIPVIRIVLALESLFLSLPLPMLTAYLLHCSGEHIRGSRLFRAVLLLWAVYALLTGCGGGGKTGSSPSGTASQETQKTEQASAAAETQAAEESQAAEDEDVPDKYADTWSFPISGFTLTPRRT